MAALAPHVSSVAIISVVARSNRSGRERTPVEEGSRLQTASRRRNHLTGHSTPANNREPEARAACAANADTPNATTRTPPASRRTILNTTNHTKPLRNNTPTTTNIRHSGRVPCGGLVNEWETCDRCRELPCRVSYGTELVGRCATWGSYIYVVRVVFGGLCRQMVAKRGFTCRLMSTHPVAAVGFPAFVYGAGSALGFVCRPRGFVPLFLLAG